jgi:hypothetical protein
MLVRMGSHLSGLGDNGNSMPTDLTETWTSDSGLPLGLDTAGNVWDLSTGSIFSGGAGGSTGGGFNLANFLNTMTADATKAYQSFLQNDLQSQLLSRGLVMNAQGQMVPAIAGMNLSSLTPILLIGGAVVGLVLIVGAMKK